MSDERGRPRGRVPPSVGSLVSKIARPAFEAHGFPSASLITDWPTVIGREFAAFTQPERLAWPRRVIGSEEDDASAPAGDNCATLILRVDGPRALEVQHAVPQLMERINTYFGYRAVGRIRIVQGPVKRTAEEKREREEPVEVEPPIEGKIADIRDTSLQRAVARLGARVAAGRRDKSQR